MDIIGEATNTDNKPVVAVSYGIANNAKYSLNNDQGYIKPEMIPNFLDIHPLPAPGPLEAVDEVLNFFYFLDCYH